MSRFPVFVSYARADAAARDRLIAAVGARGDRSVELRCDRDIRPGMDYFDRIFDDIMSAAVIAFLVSKSLLASDPVRKELAYAMARQGADSAAIAPIILEPCAWREGSLGGFQALPHGGRPVTDFASPDEAWAQIAAGLAEAVAGAAAPARDSDLQLFTDAQIVALMHEVERSLKGLIRAAEPYPTPPTNLLIDMQQLETRRAAYRAELRARIGEF